MIKFEWNEFSNENKCMNMNTELKINKNECRNRNECNTSGIKMNAVLMEMKVWIKMYNWIHKAKYSKEKYIHKYMLWELPKGSKW